MIPQPFPYQGSKRRIATQILPYIPGDTRILIEPFCGSAAVSIAAAANGLARSFALNDLNPSLMDLWRAILDEPGDLLADYSRLWNEQLPDPKAYFFKVREDFNADPKPHRFLYLLARIVKGSVRYSADGRFNQSADNRRSGMHPTRMRRQIMGTCELMSGRTQLTACDFRLAAETADVPDLLYMDPPYQGTSSARDHRYYSGLAFEEFVDSLAGMNARRLSYIVSYDGRTGAKKHGEYLPSSLELVRLDVDAGVSTQSTLLGDRSMTVESLYLSPALSARLQESSPVFLRPLQMTQSAEVS